MLLKFCFVCLKICSFILHTYSCLPITGNIYIRFGKSYPKSSLTKLSYFFRLLVNTASNPHALPGTKQKEVEEYSSNPKKVHCRIGKDRQWNLV